MTLEEKAKAQREASNRYRKAHPEKVKAQRKSYYARNKDREIENNRAYKEANPEKVKAIKAIDTAKQRANKAQRSPSWLSQSQKDEIKEWYYAAQELSKIFPWKLHVDHIVPLRGDSVSGLHVAWNLQLLPAVVNLSKRNKLEEISG